LPLRQKENVRRIINNVSDSLFLFKAKIKYFACRNTRAGKLIFLQMPLKLDYIGTELKKTAAQAAGLIREERSRWKYEDLKFKKDSSLVTSIDVATEERLVSALGKLLPEADFMAEEAHKERPSSSLMWIIDPIDGTTNFVHGFPPYCISVALWEEGKVVLGAVYEISQDECFFASAAKEGAYLNDRPIRVSAAGTLKESLLATGFMPGGFPEMDEYMYHFRTFMLNTQGLRRMGSAAMDLAWVACGRCDGFFEYGLNAWDIAAGAFIVQKAGGSVTDFSGGDDYLFGRQILASNTAIHEEFLNQFKRSRRYNDYS
jgi:myo-inositol-1(or 4)-monophosphatase